MGLGESLNDLNEMWNIPHRGETRRLNCIYMLMWYELLNSSERGERTDARASGRLGVGLGLGSKIFLGPIKFNVFGIIISKNNMHFVLKRQVVCLKNKNVTHFFLSDIKRDKRESWGISFSKLNFRDLREISAKRLHMLQWLRKVARLLLFKNSSPSHFIC